MDSQRVGSSATSAPDRYRPLRTIAAAVIAGLISLGVSFLGRKQSWPYSQSIAFAAFLFLIPVLQPIALRQRRSWASRLSFGVIFAAIGGFLHAFVLNP